MRNLKFPLREALDFDPILAETAFGKHEQGALFLGKLVDSDAPMTVSVPKYLLSDTVLLEQMHRAAAKLKESLSHPRELLVSFVHMRNHRLRLPLRSLTLHPSRTR